MTATRQRAAGHYGALGVREAASQRQIEQAFRRWADLRRAGTVSDDVYRCAESAYHVLSVPDLRSRHDRQLGLVPHPAWASERDLVVRACIGRALRHLGRGRALAARRLLGRAASLDPENPLARSYLALALARTGGCLHDAARHGRYALARRPREAAFCFNLAEVYTAAGLRALACTLRVRGWCAVTVAMFRRIH